MPGLSALSVLGLLGVLPAPVSSQDTSDAAASEQVVHMGGTVVDRRTGAPISSALITLARAVGDMAPVWVGTSSDSGTFVADSIAVGEYRIRIDIPPLVPLEELLHLSEAGAVDLRIEMVGVDYQIDPIVVTVKRLTRLEREGFYDRLRSSQGSFLMRSDIEERSPLEVTDLLVSVRGIRIVRTAYLERAVVMGPTYRECRPLIVVDGVRLDLGPSMSVDDIITPDALEAVEVYRGVEAPIQYAGRSDCGVIMIWSRQPLTGNRTFSWKRAVIAVGLGILGFVVIR